MSKLSQLMAAHMALLSATACHKNPFGIEYYSLNELLSLFKDDNKQDFRVLGVSCYSSKVWED